MKRPDFRNVRASGKGTLHRRAVSLSSTNNVLLMMPIAFFLRPAFVVDLKVPRVFNPGGKDPTAPVHDLLVFLLKRLMVTPNPFSPSTFPDARFFQALAPRWS